MLLGIGEVAGIPEGEVGANPVEGKESHGEDQHDCEDAAAYALAHAEADDGPDRTQRAAHPVWPPTASR